jgi:nucleotide-binding universal stress UspA family protein
MTSRARSLTTEHAEGMTPRSIEHREIARALKVDPSSAQILSHAAQLARACQSRLTIIHAIPHDSNHFMLPLNLDESSTREQREAEERLEFLSRDCGAAVQVQVISGPIKEAILARARRLAADVLVIGRSSRKRLRSHLSDLGYALIRESGCPVLSI